MKLHDAYLSVHEALKHAGVASGARVRVRWVDAEDMSYEEAARELEQVDGVLVPGGFGSRGWEGKILACRVARERGIPYLGICLGMHVAVSEFARHVAGLEGANSTEMDPETPYPVIDLLPEQKEIEELGGTMRLGAQAVELGEGTRVRDIYDEAVIHERHRHRYEVNNLYRDQLVEHGLVVSGTFQQGRLVEIVELPDHPWFVASQFHPEFKSRPTRPAPLFREFVGAALERARPERHPASAPRSADRLPPSARVGSPRAAAPDVAPGRAARRAVRDPEPVRATSARSPTGSRASWTRSGSRGRRTTSARRSAAGSGNVLCRLPGREEGGVPLFLCAHFDTVPVDGELEPVVEEGVLRNAGGAILGADNKSALVVMVEAARRIVEEGLPHAGVELLFTPKEEVGLVGADAFDGAARGAPGLRLRPGGPDRRRRRRLAVGPGAPPHVRGARRARGDVPRGGEVRDRGGRARDRRHAARPARRGDHGQRRAHPRRHRAQRRPRALLARGRGALARPRTGHGGRPAAHRRRGVRSERLGLHARDRDRAEVPGVPVPRRRPRRPARGRGADAHGAHAAARALGRRGRRQRVQRKGLPCVNLANGMTDIHTPDEHIAVDDVERMVDVTLALVDAARETA